ncbi:DUF2511 domain-containing protein [Streptomyces sp. NPDC005533]|uniref:DUF2511 domain-containing protein n=1 Tax=Streptomyces sp. NPDC005533 TaxID=3364723 RepID=UPI00368375A2
MSRTEPFRTGGRFRTGGLVLACVTAVATLAACGGEAVSDADKPVPLPSPTGTSQEVRKENLRHVWPLTVDRAVMECRGGDQAVVTVPDGTVYALNDRATAAGYADPRPVRAKGENGDEISLGPMLSRTLKLCRAPQEQAPTAGPS